MAVFANISILTKSSIKSGHIIKLILEDSPPYVTPSIELDTMFLPAVLMVPISFPALPVSFLKYYFKIISTDKNGKLASCKEKPQPLPSTLSPRMFLVCSCCDWF